METTFNNYSKEYKRNYRLDFGLYNTIQFISIKNLIFN